MFWFLFGVLIIIYCYIRFNFYRNLIYNNYFKFFNYLICIKVIFYDGYKLLI